MGVIEGWDVRRLRAAVDVGDPVEAEGAAEVLGRALRERGVVGTARVLGIGEGEVLILAGRLRVSP